MANNQNNQNNQNWKKNKKPKYKKSYNKNKNANHDKYKLITQLRKEIDRKEEEIARLQSEALKKDQYKPNLFLFNEEPEYTPLLDEKEKQDLIANKDKMQQNLLDMNPYSNTDFEELMKIHNEIENAKEQDERSHPLDFIEEPEREHTNSEQWNNDSSAEEPREDYYENKRLERNPWGNTRQSPWER